jgi:2,3-bisphosphoglycerate-dependent phosphoglycerate mutase
MTSTIVLVRHGQSEWNLSNRFTGWVDVGLTAQGEAEAVAAGRLLRDEKLVPGVVHTSVQQRAIRTAEILLHELGCDELVPRRAWQLNERHYGDLQGQNKKEAVAEYGEEQVLLWRRSYAIPPPPCSEAERVAQHEIPAYRDIPIEALPHTECLADVVARMMPYWQGEIVPDLTDGGVVLVVAHGNSLRALVKHLDGLSEDEVVDLNIPTGVPIVYELGTNHEVLRPRRELGDPDAIRAAAEAVAKQTG